MAKHYLKPGTVGYLLFLQFFLFLKITCQVPVAHAYTSSYSGGRDQEDVD
jgi:hypothetical protein